MILGMDKIVEHIKKLELENKELKEENEELNSSWAKKRDYDGEQYRIIINELKEKIKECEQSAGCIGQYAPDLNCMIQEIIYSKGKQKEENDKLKKELKDIRNIIGTEQSLQDIMFEKQKAEQYRDKLKIKNDELIKKVDEANKILIEYNELKEFKKLAEEECEGSAVVEDMMNRVKKAEDDKNKKENFITKIYNILIKKPEELIWDEVEEGDSITENMNRILDCSRWLYGEINFEYKDEVGHNCPQPKSVFVQHSEEEKLLRIDELIHKYIYVVIEEYKRIKSENEECDDSDYSDSE